MFEHTLPEKKNGNVEDGLFAFPMSLLAGLRHSGNNGKVNFMLEHRKEPLENFA